MNIVETNVVAEEPVVEKHARVKDLHVRDAGQRVAGVSICVQKAGEAGQVLRRALALAIRAIAVEGCWCTLTCPAPLVDGVDPKPARGRAALPGRQNLDRVSSA